MGGGIDTGLLAYALEDEPDAPVLLYALRSLRFSSSAVGNLLMGGASRGGIWLWFVRYVDYSKPVSRCLCSY